MKTVLLHSAWTALGIIVCAVCAIAVALGFSRTPWRAMAPFLFVVVVVLVASRFGPLVSVIGSLISAAIFAMLLYAPVHDLRVASPAERSALAWFVLLSVCVSYLLFPTQPKVPRS